MNILQSKGWSSGIPLRNRKDLQTLQGKAAPTKAFAHPGNEDTCSTEQTLWGTGLERRLSLPLQQTSPFLVRQE